MFETKPKNYHEAESYTGIYGMHKYWSKKPYNIIRRFIEMYSDPNDIVLEPFCGSGITVVESIITNRKTIGIDINPLAIFITEQVLKKINTNKLANAFDELKRNTKEKIGTLYQVQRNGNIYRGTHFLWEEGKLAEVWFQNASKKKEIDTPTEKDVQSAQKISYSDIPYDFPQSHFFHNPRINAYGDKKISDLFTPRNLYALSLLYNEIEKIQDDETREMMKFCFTSALGQTSKMVFVVKRRGKVNGKQHKVERKEVGSWVIGYWTPKEYFEINVWNCFENRFRKILKAKQSQERASYSVNKTNNLTELIFGDCNLALFQEPTQKVLNRIPDNSIDYVLTDPPHGDRIPYLELSMMWNSWLKKDVNYDDEIVISNAKERKKDKKNYNSLMNEVYAELYRVLKPDKHFSLMFNSLDDETWENIINHLNSTGFELKAVETLGYSANSVVQDNRKVGLKTDFVLTFQKSTPREANTKIITVADGKEKILKEITKIISKAGESGVETYQIFNSMFETFLNRDEFFRLSEILKLLQEEFENVKNKWHIKK